MVNPPFSLLSSVVKAASNNVLISPASLQILKKLAARAGFTPEDVFEISGHSLRPGAAQQLTINGVQLLPIMRAGGWRSMNVVARYMGNVDINVWQHDQNR